MQRLEVSGAVRPLKWPFGVKGLILFLKRVEDSSGEACNADGVYVVLQNQRWGKRLK
jgi:hypothetical protein